MNERSTRKNIQLRSHRKGAKEGLRKLNAIVEYMLALRLVNHDFQHIHEFLS